MRLKTDTLRRLATTGNVIGESKEGDLENMVRLVAHLDSVNAGPGINDNGSGSRAASEAAVQMTKVEPPDALLSRAPRNLRDVDSRTVACATLQFAMDTTAANVVRGSANF